MGTVWLDRLGLAAAVAVWAISAGEPQARAQEVVFSSDGARVLSCSSDKTIRLWDATTGAPLRSF